jgi:DNA end-binding protein Ku
VPARPISSANISFGLVSIPIKMFTTADHSADIRFNMLDPEHKVRLKQQYISTHDGRVVERKETIKGYEFAKGQFVTFSDEELQALSQKASPNIEITEFVPLSQVDPIFFEKSYYLGPEAGGERAYRLLAAAMRETGRCAVAKYAARGKQYLVLIRPFDDGIIMQQLFYADEVREFGEVPLGEDIEIKAGELDLAVQLIDQIAVEEFAPDKYEDDVRQRIWASIQKKVDGEEITATPDERPKAQIIDLMEALKASLGTDEEEVVAKAKRKPARRATSAAKGSKRAAAK